MAGVPGRSGLRSTWRYVAVAVAVVVGTVFGVALFYALTAPAPAPARLVTPPPTGPPTVSAATAVVGANPTETTPAMPVAAGGLLLVFVTFVGPSAAGSTPSVPVDTLGDSFSLLTSSVFFGGEDSNVTENVYAAVPSAASANLSVTVKFLGGTLATGGAVSVADVTGANSSAPVGFPIPDVALSSGWGNQAVLPVTSNTTGCLYVLGLGGSANVGPFRPGANETLVSQGAGGTGGQYEGVAYGTFVSSERGPQVQFTAGLQSNGIWYAVGVAVGPGAS